MLFFVDFVYFTLCVLLLVSCLHHTQVHWAPVYETASQQYLRLVLHLVASHQLTVPPHQPLAGYIWWSGICCRRFIDIELIANMFIQHFQQHLFFSNLLKTFLFSQYWCMQHIRGFGKDALYKSMSCIALHCRSTTSGPGPSQICNSKCGPLLDLKLSVIYYHVASVCRYALCVCM